jgi:hypothetical protein
VTGSINPVTADARQSGRMGPACQPVQLDRHILALDVTLFVAVCLFLSRDAQHSRDTGDLRVLLLEGGGVGIDAHRRRRLPHER